MAPSPTRRRSPRALLIAALLLAPLALVSAPQAAASSAGSTGSAGSSAGDRLAGAHDPDWMRRLPDGASLASLSIPGTHDTMTAGATIVSQTQDASLPQQLDAGVRALDIRTRHFRDAFSIHHGPEYLHANFTDVVREVADFLRANPTETVLMRMKSESTEAENTRSYEDTLDWYVHDNPETRDLLREHLWTPPAGYDGAIPTLGQARGRIVILQDFTATTAFGPQWGGSRMDIQDDYVLSGLADVTRKWDEARAQFDRARAGAPKTLYVNHLSATGVPDPGAIVSGALPVTIADGALGVTGMNARALDYLTGAGRGRTGVVMTDFPTAALVAEIIAHNDFR
ncbi:phosphatidylinositol-specific phospholipase C [Rhodococcus sp. NPDC127528]|uniref:phosphatidylinositol-specific phospholipase C n=1 Tax=unclassified Rhodococcus (in: high G+C Gram-positive bacteria) TaxID=192944 RepID=UPI003645588D